MTPSDLLTTGLLSGGLIYVVKKIAEMKTPTTPIVKDLGTTTGRFFGAREDITQAEYRKGLETFLTSLSAGQGAYKGNGFEAGYKKDYEPKQIFSLWQPAGIGEIKQPVIIPADVDYSTGFIEGSKGFKLEDINKKLSGGRL